MITIRRKLLIKFIKTNQSSSLAVSQSSTKIIQTESMKRALKCLIQTKTNNRIILHSYRFPIRKLAPHYFALESPKSYRALPESEKGKG